ITVISNAAREPHVVDLARCLVGMGARISGVGTELIVIEGSGSLLHGTDHSVTTDYIEAGTYMVAAAATQGDVVAERMRPTDVRWLSNRLRGARVVVPDIRSGAALVIAALCAEGTSQLENAFHLDRGYEDLDGKLCSLGAQLERLRGTEAEVAIRDFSGVVGD